MSPSKRDASLRAGRDDLAPSAMAGYSHVLCTRCQRYRMSAPLDALPAPGVCEQCRVADPHTYWIRDWERKDD